MIRVRVIIGVAILAAIVWWFAPQSPEIVAANVPTPHAAPVVQHGSARSLTAVPALDGTIQAFEGAAKMLFSEREVSVQAPAAVVAVPPTLPDTFQLLGKAQIDGAWKAIIAVDGKSYLAGPGDKLVDRFVVEKLVPPLLVIVDLSQGSARFDLSIGSAP